MNENEENLLKILDTKIQCIFQSELNIDFLSIENQLLNNISHKYSNSTCYKHLSDLIINYFGTNIITKLIYQYVINNYNILWCVEEDEDSEVPTVTIEEKQVIMSYISICHS